MKKGVLNIAVSPWQKTSLAEAGIFDMNLPDGAKIVALGHTYFPDHDRSLIEGIVLPFLQDYQPDVIFGLGGILHDDAFTTFAPRKDPKKVAVHTHAPAPELAAIQASEEGFEDGVLAFGRSCGQFITRIAEAGKSHFVYIPSASPLLPNEWEIVKFLYFTKKRIDEWMERHPDEAPEEAVNIPTSSEDFNKLLGLDNDGRVTVLPFSAGVLMNGHTLFMVGDFRRRNPLTAGYTEFEQRHLNIVRGFDGKLADGWFTKGRSSLPTEREYWQFHEVGNLMDSQRMGYIRDYDRWGKGLFVGTVVKGQLHGCSFPVLYGKDGRRCVVINGKGYSESAPAGLGRRGTLTLPARAK